MYTGVTELSKECWIKYIPKLFLLTTVETIWQKYCWKNYYQLRLKTMQCLNAKSKKNQAETKDGFESYKE